MRQASRDDADAVTLPATPPSSKAHRGPFSYHFLGKEKEIVEARRIFVTILFQRTMLVVVSILLVFSVYWAAVQRLPARSLQGWIVDFDGEDVGQFVANALKATTSFGPTITWNVRDAAAEFPNGPDDLLQAVLNEACWVAVAINPGVSKSLNESLAGSGSSYNSSNAIAAYSLEGRNENAFRAVLRPTVTTALDSITHSYAVKRVSSLLTSNAPITNISPDILTRPVYFTFQNLRPFDVGVATAVTFIGLIYLLILSFIVVNSGIMARATSGLDDKLTTASLIRVRVISPLICYLPLTLAYSLLTLAFGFPFDRYFGRGGFMAFWMLSWFGMAAAGLALESMTTLLTGKYIQIFMVLWIIGNVAVCLWPIDALPVLYRYGYVSPFYNISRGVRAIAFGTKNDLGLNFGVLSVWIVISCISLPLVQWYRRREQVRAAEKRVVLPKSSV
ncbi:hypothetical protein BDN70DRAFT_813978 [Pholiota conissans]|uniref:DUF3533 domain-containing protein n=1 Tax=Pholiota conissans TaxID=109636 RepID=A0A9P6CWT7_9AGAR|nr:hypothetical protein BDN70DRAFT_813978 [Pholiota conissans]